MGAVGVLVNIRSSVAVPSAVLVAFGCGGVTSDGSGRGGHAGVAAAGGRGGGGGEVAGAGVLGGGVAGAGVAGAGVSGGASTTDDGSEAACSGTQVRIGGRCVALGTVQPCARPRPSGFPGDSQCIDAPSPPLGMQLHFGPKDYTDPDEVAKFTLPPGTSDAGCMYMKAPSSTDVHVKEWHARVRPGAYEAILFEDSASHPDSAGPESCAAGAGKASAIVSVVGTDLDLSLDGDAPEYAGAGMAVAAGTQLSFYVNMANTTDAPLLVEAWLNGVYAEEPVTMEAAPITWLGGLAMNIAPHSSKVVQAGAAATTQMSSCTPSADTNVLALIGSTGSHTTRTAAYVERASDASRSMIYESFDWATPVRLYYDSVVENPSSDSVARIAGGPSGILALHPGDAISWECAIENKTDASLTYSDDAFTGELCNFYGVYGGGTAPWNCYSP